MLSTPNKIVDLLEASKIRKTWQKDGERVVFTNGCFDLLHLGHIDYLEKARSLGGKLIVGLNDDNSVRRLKGSQRPIQGLESRSRLLAAMEFVDLVVPFSDDTPLQTIAHLEPDILVKGSDYSIGNIVGADIVTQSGGEVRTIDFLDGHSTTATIKKIVKIDLK